MKTREQLRAELELANPFTDIGGKRYGPGDAEYEALMEKWLDAAEAAQIAQVAINAENAERQQIRDLIDALKAGTGTATVRIARVEKCVAYLLRHTLLIALLLFTACTQPMGNVQRERVWIWQTNFHQ